MASKTGLLLQWAQRHTAGFPGVALRDFTRSWRSGLAWGALIAHFAPDALDYSTLDQRAATENDPDACRANLTKVFEVAKKLGIPALLDVDDMVDLPVPEKHSVTTYTICFYNRFGEDGKPQHAPGLRASAPALSGPAEAPELGQSRPTAERRRLMRTPSTRTLAATAAAPAPAPPSRAPPSSRASGPPPHPPPLPAAPAPLLARERTSLRGPTGGCSCARRPTRRRDRQMGAAAVAAAVAAVGAARRLRASARGAGSRLGRTSWRR